MALNQLLGFQQCTEGYWRNGTAAFRHCCTTEDGDLRRRMGDHLGQDKVQLSHELLSSAGKIDREDDGQVQPALTTQLEQE